MTSKKYIFFDFDGTLVDSSEGIYRAFAKSCNQIKVYCPSIETFKSLIGPPIREIAATCIPGISSTELHVFEKHFRHHYDSEDFLFVKWYPGALEWISSTCQHILPFYIVTNKPTLITKSIISSAGIGNCFVDVIGIDYRVVNRTGIPFKDKSDAINFLLTSLNINPCSVLYLGDTPSDLKSCFKNNVKFVAATYGFHDWSSQEIGTNLRASSFKDVINIVSNVNKSHICNC